MFFNMRALSIAAVLAVVSPALAQVSSTTREICTTELGSSSLNSVPTTTRTSTNTPTRAFVRSTTTPSTTVTPTTSTATAVATSFATTTSTTVISQSTSTFTTTQTILEVVSTTITAMATTTTTATSTTVTTPTTTIPTSAGFTPIESSNPGAAKLRRREVGHARRQVRSRSSSTRATTTRSSTRSNSASRIRPTATGSAAALANLPRLAVVSGRIAAVNGSSQFPTTVTCNREVRAVSTSTIVVTARNTSTVTASQPMTTTTITPTFTVTAVSNQVPASTTSTVFVTTTTTVSGTTTSTSTVTAAATATLAAAPVARFAACADDNIATTFNGQPITNNAALMLGVVDVDTAYDCCVRCQLNGICAGSAFSAPVAGQNGGRGQCMLFAGISGTCDPTALGFLFYENGENINGGPLSPLAVSNGNCGYGIDGGEGPRSTPSQPSPAPA